MSTILIESHEGGTHQFNNVFIKKGVNEIRSGDYDALKKDEGFKIFIKKGRFVELSQKEITHENRVKAIESEKKAEIEKIKKDHAEEIKQLTAEAESRFNKFKIEQDQKIAELVTNIKELEKKVKQSQTVKKGK